MQHEKQRVLSMKLVNQKQKFQAYYLLKLQALSVLFMFLILFAFYGLMAASGALLGAAISLIANLLCIRRMFKSSSLEAKELLGQFYLAETMKIGVTVLMFVIVYRFLTVNYLFLIVGYCGAQISFWVAPLVVGKTKPMKLNNLDSDAGQVLWVQE